ncbi:MAG: hypothetical protein CVU90_11350 [Firmicutes bacterium HGW-Firmicutes-15]|nr:MAG: hypothetical protein CVU90_11350 [Firmicutes bacterium HGW-Firmicutes-15]
MDNIQILERLVSVKSNAHERASQESKGHPEHKHVMKAFILEKGIEQLIIEIQNSILAEYQTTNALVVYKRGVSSQAS